jgi:sulfhydrogenase subunit beta (sulfur reductase)
MSTTTLFRLERAAIDEIISLLQREQYTVVGPVLRGASVELGELRSTADLPLGCADEQTPGRYRIVRLPVESLFSYTVSPHSWKRYLFPPILKMFSATRTAKGFDFNANGGGVARASIPDARDTSPSYAFLGIRSCDLHALAVQDKVFGGGGYGDEYYRRARERTWIIAVNCTLVGGTCFCASMKTGPKASSGFDLALTEIITEHEQYFLTEVGTDRGRALLDGVKHRPAEASEVTRSEELMQNATRQMGRSLDTENIRQILYQNAEHPRWDTVAARCLTCANCTMVCPTCFCTTMEDSIDLGGTHAERLRKWDSCFTMDFSYIHGGSVRPSVRARYRHWLTHKLASWIDQFGLSGCVGCGRCITWCPVGIDITEEYGAIRESFLAMSASSSPKEAHDGNA